MMILINFCKLPCFSGTDSRYLDQRFLKRRGCVFYIKFLTFRSKFGFMPAQNFLPFLTRELPQLCITDINFEWPKTDPLSFKMQKLEVCQQYGIKLLACCDNAVFFLCDPYLVQSSQLTGDTTHL